MRQHLALPHLHPSQCDPRVGKASIPSAPLVSSAERWQTWKDKLAVAAVLLLVLATLSVFVLYLVRQAPYFASGELTGFATPIPGAAQAAASANLANLEAANSAAWGGLGRIPLILISTAVEMAIFVALGLYLRHDMNQKP